MSDKIGIVTPVYAKENSKRLLYLQDALESVKKQQFADFVHLTVDDSSPCFAVEDIVNSMNDARFLYSRRNKNQGDRFTASNALNYGFSILCKEFPLDYICFLHSDDMFTKDSLLRRSSEIKGFSFVYSSMLLMYGNTVEYKPSPEFNTHEEMLQHAYRAGLMNHTLMWDVNFIREVNEMQKIPKSIPKYDMNIFDPRLAYGEDMDVAILSVLASKKTLSGYSRITEPTVTYRVHPESITDIMTFQEKVSDLRLIGEKYGFVLQEPYKETIAIKLRRPWMFLPKSARMKLREHKFSALSALGICEYQWNIEHAYWFRNNNQTCKLSSLQTTADKSS